MGIVIDRQHRIRDDRVDAREHIIWRTRDRLAETALFGIKRFFCGAIIKANRGETERLLYDTD